MLNIKQQISSEQLTQLCVDTVAKAKQLGADAAEVNLGIGIGFSLNVRKGALENIEYSNGKDLGITVYFGHRTGSAVTSDFKPQAIELMLNKACYIARFTNEDPCIDLADPELMAYGYPDLNLYHNWNIDVATATALATECEAMACAYDKRITNSEGCGVNSSQSFRIYANSHGFLGKIFSSNNNIGCTVIAEENHAMQRDNYYTTARDANDLEAIKTVATIAAERTVKRLSPRHITTRHCPIIFHAEIASELLAEFIIAITGNNLYRRASFLVDHLGKQIFPKHVQIDERPLIPKAIGSAPFDTEGVKLQQSSIITDGILQRYVLDSYSARKLGLKTTGNSGGIYNLFINTSDLNLTGLLKQMGTGLLITDLMGDGVNVITGNYSRGAFGYWVENGEIQYPVEGITIASNLKDMFLHLVAVANDVDHRSNILTGSILIDNMVVAGQ